VEVLSTAVSCFFPPAVVAVIGNEGTLEVVFVGNLVRDSVVTSLKRKALGLGSSPKHLETPKLFIS
jgi:hypothetical protein